MVRFCVETGAIVITNDHFRDWVSQGFMSQDRVDTMVFSAEFWTAKGGWVFDTVSKANKAGRELLEELYLAKPESVTTSRRQSTAGAS